MTATATINAAFKVFVPRPRVRTLDWARDNIQTHEGRPYDHSAYPHLGAPGGPLDAFDSRQFSTIILQWASRLGKTFGGQVCCLKTADCEPCPMMFASADQKLSTEVTARTYRMLERCPSLKHQLRPPHRRKQHLIDLESCRQYVAWARSVSTLADKAVKVGHANEIDKWEHASTAKEADPLELFKDRFKEFPTHKMILESTPAQKTTSRIERLRLGSTNCQYYVPCPHCKRYQTLDMKRLTWEKTDAGKSDKDKARETAHYLCCHCEGVIKDEHRGMMMRLGVWCPEGCRVVDAVANEYAVEWKSPREPWKCWKDSPWVEGDAVRNGRDAGFQLSSLYALSLGWGDIAAKFVETKSNPQNLRNFINQWLAETWETVRNRTTWEQLGSRMITDVPPMVVPHWATFLTMGVDRQAEGGDRFPWVVVAWGPDRRCALVGYGEADSLTDIDSHLIERSFPHQDGGASVPISFALIDSGYRPDGIYEFSRACVRKKKQVWPSKGSSTALESDYRQATLGENTSMPGMVLFHIDTIRTQLWMEAVLHTLKCDDAGGGSIHAGSLGTHEDLLQQLLNDAAVTSLDSKNNARESWERIDANIPNDYRDCWRNAYGAMLIFTRGKPIPPRVLQAAPKKIASDKDKPRVNNIIQREGGWIPQRRDGI